MNIAVAVKVVPDDQDIAVAADRTLDYSKAHQVVSEYDLNAIEAAALLAEDAGATLYAVSASNAKADDLKVKKSILSRGPVRGIGEVDIVVCGDGSADMYAGQVDVQLAAELGMPVVNAVTSIKLEDGVAVVERTLPDVVEEIEVPLPAVVAVTPECAYPRIAGMREILTAGKKPATVTSAADAGVDVSAAVEIASVTAPEQAARKRQVFDMKNDGDFDAFASAVAAAVRA